MANLIEAGMSIIYDNFHRINEFSSDFDFSVLQFMKIFKKYFSRYRLELAHRVKRISHEECEKFIIKAENFIMALRTFTSNTVTFYDHFVNYGEKMIKLAGEINTSIENANNDLLMIYQALKKYNDLILIHNTIVIRFNSFKSDFKYDIIGQINQFIYEFENFNQEHDIYSLRIHLILQSIENFKRRLNSISQTINLSLAESVNQSILDQIANAIV